jgi:hypothetical protein
MSTLLPVRQKNTLEWAIPMSRLSAEESKPGRRQAIRSSGIRKNPARLEGSREKELSPPGSPRGDSAVDCLSDEIDVKGLGKTDIGPCVREILKGR